MRFYIIFSLLTICGLTVAAAAALPSHSAVSYAYITKQEPDDDHDNHYYDHHENGYQEIIDHRGDENYHFYPKYDFNYGVEDPHTGDVKEQWEQRDGDRVKGSYSFKEADGSTRVVEYIADDHNGFQAFVKNVGGAEQKYDKNYLW